MTLWLQLIAYECAFQEWLTHSGADDPLGWPSEPGYRGLFLRQRGWTTDDEFAEAIQ